MDWSSLRKNLLCDAAGSILPPQIKLPIFPRALRKFSERYEDPAVTSKELAGIVESDAGLTVELLRYVNSAAMGLRRTLHSVQQAINILGIRNTGLHLSVSAIKQAMRSSESQLINFQTFWSTNLERALFAREIARLMKTDAELAFAAALIGDFLLPVLTNQLLSDYLEFSKGQRIRPQNLTEFEAHRFGWDHARAAGEFLARSGFPDDLICCVVCHHRGLSVLIDPGLARTAASAVALAGLMPDFLQQVPQGLDELVNLENLWPQFNVMQLAKTVDDEFQTQSEGQGGNHLSFLHRVEKRLAVT